MRRKANSGYLTRLLFDSGLGMLQLTSLETLTWDLENTSIGPNLVDLMGNGTVD